MIPYLQKLTDSLKRDGLIKTARKCSKYIQDRYEARRFQAFKERRKIASPNVIFTEIYRKNIWGNKESVSGCGSTLEYTENLRKDLPLLVDRFSLQSIYDAPCGDFNWMQYVVFSREVHYLGADIVRALVQRNIDRFQSDNRQFIVADIMKDPFPRADLWMCRDCLFHFSYKDIHLALSNFGQSKIPYALLSTHVNDGSFKNNDIYTGDCRVLDLFGEPFNLPRDMYFTINDYVEPCVPRHMCLWSREQIADALPMMRRQIGCP